MGNMAKAMEYRKLSEIKKLEGNPRVIRDKEFKTLCNSIRDNSEYFDIATRRIEDTDPLFQAVEVMTVENMEKGRAMP